MNKNFEIIFLPDAFIVDINEERDYIKWIEIIKVVVYKKDLLAIDLICMDIFVNNTILTISEDFYNWEKFIEIMNSKLNIQSDWFPEVAHPAFARNETILYEAHT